MATTNIHRIKVGNKALKDADIQVGLAVSLPIATGGSVRGVCKAASDKAAVFASTDKNWPLEYTVRFNQPDFTLEDFYMLQEATAAFDSWRAVVTPEHRAMIHRGVELGYAYQTSHTQAGWTEVGIEAFAAKRDEDGYYRCNGYKIMFSRTFNEWQATHEEEGGIESFHTFTEARDYAAKG